MIAIRLTGPEMLKQIWFRLREYAFSTDYGRLDRKCVQFVVPGRGWKVFVNLTDHPLSSSMRIPGRGYVVVQPGTMLAESGGPLSQKREAVVIGAEYPPTSVGELDTMAKLLEDLNRACHKTRG